MPVHTALTHHSTLQSSIEITLRWHLLIPVTLRQRKGWEVPYLIIWAPWSWIVQRGIEWGGDSMGLGWAMVEEHPEIKFVDCFLGTANLFSFSFFSLSLRSWLEHMPPVHLFHWHYPRGYSVCLLLISFLCHCLCGWNICFLFILFSVIALVATTYVSFIFFSIIALVAGTSASISSFSLTLPSWLQRMLPSHSFLCRCLRGWNIYFLFIFFSIIALVATTYVSFIFFSVIGWNIVCLLFIFFSVIALITRSYVSFISFSLSLHSWLDHMFPFHLFFCNCPCGWNIVCFLFIFFSVIALITRSYISFSSFSLSLHLWLYHMLPFHFFLCHCPCGWNICLVEVILEEHLKEIMSKRPLRETMSGKLWLEYFVCVTGKKKGRNACSDRTDTSLMG